jgi:hypothetical protein
MPCRPGCGPIETFPHCKVIKPAISVPRSTGQRAFNVGSASPNSACGAPGNEYLWAADDYLGKGTDFDVP